MDIGAFGSWMSMPECLFFDDFEGLPLGGGHEVYVEKVDVPALSLTDESGKERAHKLKKNAWDTGRCPWDTRRDKRGSTGRCPRDFLLITIEKRTEKAIFAGTPAGCCRDTRPSRGFQKFYVIFSYVPFLLPNESPVDSTSSEIITTRGWHHWNSRGMGGSGQASLPARGKHVSQRDGPLWLLLLQGRSAAVLNNPTRKDTVAYVKAEFSLRRETETEIKRERDEYIYIYSI